MQADPDSKTPALLNTQKIFASIWTVLSSVLVNHKFIKILNYSGFMDHNAHVLQYAVSACNIL